MRWRLIISLFFIASSVLMTHWPESWQPVLEQVYGQQLYPSIQAGLGLLPSAEHFLLADALWLVIPIAFIVRIFWLIKTKLTTRFFNIGVETIVWMSGIYFVFMLVWGLNYQREALYDHLKQQGFTNKLSAGHFEFALAETQKTIHNMPENFDFCAPELAPFSALRPSAFAHSALSLANIKPSPSRAVRPSVWSDIYTPLGVAGVYLMPTGEPSISRHVYNLAKPFVMTHEYSHWAGYAREYDADIISYWSLWLSPDPVWQYSAWLHWWQDIAEPEWVQQQLPQALRISMQCYRQHNAQQPRWKIKKSFWRVYETNLKNQGVTEGLKSYTLGAAMALSSYQDWLYKKAQR